MCFKFHGFSFQYEAKPLLHIYSVYFKRSKDEIVHIDRRVALEKLNLIVSTTQF